MRSIATRRQRGVSLIELLIGATVGAFALVALMQTISAYEGRTRTTRFLSGAQENGLVAAYQLERDVRMAGIGLFITQQLLCNEIRAWRGAVGEYTIDLMPVRVIDGGTGPDQITVLYSNSATGGLPLTTLRESMPDSAAIFKVDSVAGVQVGDRLVLAQPPKFCSSLQVTAISAPAEILAHNPGQSDFNPPGGHNIFPKKGDPGCPPPDLGGNSCGYDVNAHIVNFGELVSRRYEIAGTQLQRVDLPVATGDVPSVLADGIVDLQVQYGISATAASRQVTAWVDATGATWGGLPSLANRTRIKALRIAVVARSGLLEREEISPASLKLWPDSASAPTTTGPTYTIPSGEARRYRYRVYTTIVPLRNVIWGTS
jgi:type IV pilus assembly protein PilW